jgi:hypothetical protein
VKIRFFPRRSNQRSLVDFEIDVTTPGDLLEGHTIRGFSLWKRKQEKDGDLPYSVLFPSKPYTNKDGEQDYFSFIKLTNGEDDRYRTRFIRTVIDAYEKWESGGGR